METKEMTVEELESLVEELEKQRRDEARRKRIYEKAEFIIRKLGNGFGKYDCPSLRILRTHEITIRVLDNNVKYPEDWPVVFQATNLTTTCYRPGKWEEVFESAYRQALLSAAADFKVLEY